MSEITLRELCKEYGVSRRAVQGYEKMGLVSPSGKTPQGYLLYDEVVQKRIHTIHRLQQFGFQLKEVKALAGKSNAEMNYGAKIRNIILSKKVAVVCSHPIVFSLYYLTKIASSPIPKNPASCPRVPLEVSPT